MARLCFVSYEISPTTKGGAGVLLRNLAEVLLAADHEVILVLDLPPWDFERFVSRDRFSLPQPDRCRAYHVGSLVDGHGPTEADFQSHFAWRAYRIHEACRIVDEVEQPGVIEFFDYGGIGHYALSAKVAGLGYQRTHLAVRLHTSLELMDRVSAETALDVERESAFAMEHGALRLAETVLFPTRSYLEEAYLPFYEPWFGNLVESPPPVVDTPAPRRHHQDQDIVLYYGRLSRLKGVDLFIDAALTMLRAGEADSLTFYLVGFDPTDPESTWNSGDTLRERLPSDLQSRFVFTGQWERHQLNRLLPRVRFAVLPTYLESFGYAAHELRAAGVPLVLSSIPAFRDHFTHTEDALLFDGTVDDLHRQMSLLSSSDELRRRLAASSPPPAPSLDFYDEHPRPSWMRAHQAPGENAMDLLVCILADDPERLSQTARAVEASPSHEVDVVVLRPGGTTPGRMGFWFLGGVCVAERVNGTPVEPTQILTRQSLLLLRAGDVPLQGLIDRCLEVLERQTEIDYVGCWKQRADGSIDTFPVDLMPESIPFLSASLVTRCVMRTESGRLLIDLFDRRAGILSEIKYLSMLDAGLVLPEVRMSVQTTTEDTVSPEMLSYAVMSDDSEHHARRLARLLVASQSLGVSAPHLDGVFELGAAPSSAHHV